MGEQYQSKVNEEINKSLLNTASARGVLTFCEWSSGEFDVTNAVTALHRMARATDRRYYSKDPRWPSVIGKAHQMIVQTCSDPDAWPRLSKEYLLNAAWSFASLEHRDEYLMNCIADEVLDKTKDLGPADIANLTRSFANLKIQNEAVLDRVLVESKQRMSNFRPQALAGLSWSLATLQFKDDEIMDRMGRESIAKIRLFAPKQLADLAWAYSCLGIRKPAFNGAMSDAMLGRIEEFQVKDLARITVSFASLSAATETVMEIIADKLTLRVGDLSPDEMEKVTWAFATAKYNDEAVLSSIITEVLNRLEEFEPSHLSAMAWSFWNLGVKEELFIDAVRDVLKVRLDEFLAVDLAKVLPAFVDWECNADVEGVLFTACMEKMMCFSPWDLASVARAFSRFGDNGLLSLFLEGAVHRFSEVCEYADANNWVEFTTIVAHHAEPETINLFEPKFHAALLKPLLLRLRNVSTVPCSDAPGLVAAMKALQDFVLATKLEDVGPFYARQALLALYIAPILSSTALCGGSDLLMITADDESVAGACWELRWRRNLWLEQSGRIFSSGVPRTGSKLLPPLPGARARALRHSLLHVSAIVLRRCPEEKLREVIGYFRVILSSPPSLDCMAALCQFRRHFHGVRLEVDYHGLLLTNGNRN